MKRHHFLWMLGLIFGSSLIVAACTDDSLMEPEQQPAPTSELASSPANPLSAALGLGQCMGNDAVDAGVTSGFANDPLAFNCTANDVRIANAQTLSGDPISCVPGQPISDPVDIVADIVETSTSVRHDIGIWIENGDNMGGGAEDGACNFYYFDEGDIATEAGAIDGDGDQCGDMENAGTVEDFLLGDLSLVCPTDPVVVDGVTYIEIASCVSWTQPGGDRVCPISGESTPDAERFGTLPANKSKCNCEPFLVEVELKAQLTLKKNVTNNGGGTAKASAWTLNAGSLINEAGSCTDDGSVCSMAVTSTQLADPGDYALSETNGPSNYSVSSDWSCDGGSLNTSTNTITLAAGDDVTCQITNDDDDPSLTLKKTVINNAGGTAKANEWTLNAGSLINEAGSCTDDGSVCAMALTSTVDATAGVGYALSETNGPSGYAVSTDWSCDGGSLSSNTITLGLGDDVTCTIENDDAAAMLTLKKTVVNNDGGTAKANEWTLNAGSLINEAGTCTDSGDPCLMALTTKTEANANTGYALSETNGPSNYSVDTDWSCDGGNLSSNTITLGLGDDVTCTIVNTDDPPSLTLKKSVINNDGGTAKANEWTLNAGSLINEAGSCTDSGDPCLMALTTKTEADANTGYALSETSGPTGYSVSTDWQCDGGSLSSNTITLGLGDDVTCTIENDDDGATLKLVKSVATNDGGSGVPDDWTLTATSQGSDASRDISTAGGSGSFQSVFTNTAYTLAESPNPGTGYSSTGQWSCDGGTSSSGNTVITLSANDQVTCTIINDDIAPTLRLVKNVINLDGGTSVPDDWTLTAISTGSDASRDISTAGGSGNFETVFANVGYTLAESGPGGYTAGSWSCDGGNQSGNVITLALDDDVTCTIVNDDIPQECEDGQRLTSVSLMVIDARPDELRIEVSDDNPSNFDPLITVDPAAVGTQFTVTPASGTFFDSQNLRFALGPIGGPTRQSKNLKVHLSCSDDPAVGDIHSGNAPGGFSVTLQKTGFTATDFN